MADNPGRDQTEHNCQTRAQVLFINNHLPSTQLHVLKKADEKKMHSSLQQTVKLEHLLCSCVIKRYGHFKPVALQLGVSRAPARNNVRGNLKVKSQRGRQLQMDVSQLFWLLLYIKTLRCMSPFLKKKKVKQTPTRSPALHADQLITKAERNACEKKKKTSPRWVL